MGYLFGSLHLFQLKMKQKHDQKLFMHINQFVERIIHPYIILGYVVFSLSTVQCWCNWISYRYNSKSWPHCMYLYNLRRFHNKDFANLTNPQESEVMCLCPKNKVRAPKQQEGLETSASWLVCQFILSTKKIAKNISALSKFRSGNFISPSYSQCVPKTPRKPPRRIRRISFKSAPYRLCDFLDM